MVTKQHISWLHNSIYHGYITAYIMVT